MKSISEQRAHSIQDLVSYYRSLNPEKNLFIGIELERSGVFRDSLDPVSFEGEKSYMSVFQQLEKEVGWEVIERDGERIYALQRGDTKIVTEADGRPELTGSPKIHLHDLAREYRLHERELREIGNIFNIAWLPLGLHPFAANSEISLAPKKRYEVFMDVDDSPWMHTWMKRMNGIHTNFSVTDEANAISKAQTAFRILPIISAIYSSSPFLDRKPLGMLNGRRAMTNDHPPVRLDLPPTILSKNFSYEEWILHIIHMPMSLMYTKEGIAVRPPPMTFADWMERGYNDEYPTIADFDQHVKAIWSDIRLRPSYIEYRVADSLPSALALSLPALMKGLLFDSDSWSAVEAFTRDWTYEDVIHIDRESWKKGLQTEVNGKKLLTYAQELITIASEKLQGFNRLDASNEDESVYLDEIKKQIFVKEQSPAEELVDLYEHDWNKDLGRLIEWCEQGDVAS